MNEFYEMVREYVFPLQIDGVYCIVYQGVMITCDFENHLGRNGK